MRTRKHSGAAVLTALKVATLVVCVVGQVSLVLAAPPQSNFDSQLVDKPAVDSDGDWLADFHEVNKYFTDPKKADSELASRNC